MKKVKFVIGLLIYAVLFLIYGRYLANKKMYRMAQESNGFAMNFFDSPLTDIFTDYIYMKKNINQSALPDLIKEQYLNDSLFGYGDAEFKQGDAKELSSQQRFLVVPEVEKTIEKADTIIEVGTGNGDIIAYLAAKYPMKKFIGIDFSVKNASLKHNYRNLTFIKGYALEKLKEGLKGDLVFGTSTFIVMTPLMIPEYFGQFYKNGIRYICISDPCFGGYTQENNDRAVSRHLEETMWYHNYSGYLKKANYEVISFSFSKYTPPGCNRPDVYQLLLTARIADKA